MAEPPRPSRTWRECSRPGCGRFAKAEESGEDTGSTSTGGTCCESENDGWSERDVQGEAAVITVACQVQRTSSVRLFGMPSFEVPWDIIYLLFCIYLHASVARCLRSVSRQVRAMVFLRTQESIGRGKWRSFVNRKTGQILLQQLFLCENKNELRLHSYMNATPYPVVFEMAIHIGRDESFQRRTAVSSILCKHGAKKWIWGDHIEEWEVMNRVGGGADFAFTPSWQLPIVVLECTSRTSFAWTVEVTPRDDIVLECRRNLRGVIFWVEVDCRACRWPPSVPRMSMAGQEFFGPIHMLGNTGEDVSHAWYPTQMFLPGPVLIMDIQWDVYCACVMEEVD